MKRFKMLLVLFIATMIISPVGVFAAYFQIRSYTNVSVPAFNGDWYSSYVTLETLNMGRHHYIDNVSITPSYDDLDIRVQKKDFGSGSWKILAHGKSVYLTDGNSSAGLYMQGGDFRLNVDSRITYIRATTINTMRWGLNL